MEAAAFGADDVQQGRGERRRDRQHQARIARRESRDVLLPVGERLLLPVGVVERSDGL